MPTRIDRRDFLGAAAAAAAAATLPRSASAEVSAPAVHIRPPARPVAVASANGIRGVARAGELIAGGMDPLDAAIEGVKIQELDPEDDSVGYGGLPNENGVVQLDASCMHGPSRRAGAVGCLEGIKTPSVVTKYVLLYTNHILLVGEGARRFALSYGFQEEDLLTDHSREAWLRWRANRGPDDDWLNVEDGAGPMARPTGTINLNTINPNGDIASVTTTSGLAWKVPGRVGDSPIVGAGQYCDNEIGAAGSTGRGESNIKVCGAFLTVEHMRRGLSPTDAALETLRRAVAASEPRLMRGDRPTFGLTFYALNKRGDVGAASMTPTRYAVWDGERAEHRDTAYLFERSGG